MSYSLSAYTISVLKVQKKIIYIKADEKYLLSSRMNNGPPKYQALGPGTYKCYFIWKKSLWRCD